MIGAVDSEMVQLRALAAMDGVEALLELADQSAEIRVEAVLGLVTLVHDAARAAIPKSPLYHANED